MENLYVNDNLRFSMEVIFERYERYIYYIIVGS